MSQVHPLTGIWLTLFVVAGAGVAILMAAIGFDRYLDRRAKRMRERLPRAQVQPSDARRS